MEETQVETETQEEQPNTDHVDFGSPEAQEKFDRVYGDMKRYKGDLQRYESNLNTVAQQNAALLDKLDKLERSTADSEVSTTVAGLRKQETEALEAGEFEKAVSLRDQITDLKVKSNTTPPAPKPEPAPQADDGDQRALNAFLDERNQDGTLKRPWVELFSPGC